MTEKQIKENEFNLEKLFTTIANYKWLIIFLVILSTLLMFLNLYFKPSIYSSKSIIEVKSKSKPKMSNDILVDSLSFGPTGKIEKEVEFLKTFAIANKALEKVSFSVRYFKTKNYKEIEVYKNFPLSVEDITIYNKHLIGKVFTLHPHNDYFTLSIKNSITSFLSPESTIELDTNQKYHYNEMIKNEFFKFKIIKKSNFNKDLKFVLAGSNRQIYTDVIEKSLNVHQVNPNASLIEISFQDNIPQRADDYINALVESFIETSIQNKNEQNNKLISFIDKELENSKSLLQASEDKLETYKAKHKITQPSVQAKKYIEKLSELEIKLSENVLKQKLISNLVAFTRKNQNLDAIAPSLVELNDKPTLQLITTLQNLQIEETNLKTELTDQHPKLITIRQQIKNIRNKITYNLKNLKSLILQKNKSLNTEKLSYTSRIKSLPKEEKTIVNINRNYKISTDMYNYLLKKKTESELLMVSTFSDYKIIDKAYTNILKPIKPKKALLMSVAPLIGLLLGIILATILQALNKKISSYEELETLSNFPILGLIPELNKKNVHLEVYNEPASRFTESYRSLRTNLPNRATHGRGQIILLTSTIANEGKTTITSNLASIFQMAGHKSIVINLDLRKPNLHNYFNLKNEKGMSSYLMGNASVEDIIFTTEYTNLHVITSGPIPPNPSELILSPRLSELLELLKTHYDYIFIDSAPVGLVSDAIHLMKLADQNLIVVRENYAEESFMPSLSNLINKNEIENIGLILNRSKSKTTSYGYGYGYGYE